MYTKELTYVDFNGETRTEIVRFNLTEAEITELNFEYEGGLDGIINEITKTKDNKKLIELFKTLLIKSYGVKSEDGRKFMKSQAIKEDFEFSPLYPKMFMLLATDDEEAAKFINEITPNVEGKADIIKSAKEKMQ